MRRIPFLVRMTDGAIFHTGQVVNYGLKIFIVKFCFVSNDLQKKSVMVIDAAVAERSKQDEIVEEEMMLDLEEIIPMSTWQLSPVHISLAKELSSNSFQELFNEIGTFPHHIQREIRKHSLIAMIRRNIQYFCQGLEMVANMNLGLINWEHDIELLQLSSKKPELLYRIEEEEEEEEKKFIDQFLGPQWDLADLSPAIEGYRIILMFELSINNNAELSILAHATTCNAKPEAFYRSQYLKLSQDHFNLKDYS